MGTTLSYVQVQVCPGGTPWARPFIKVSDKKKVRSAGVRPLPFCWNSKAWLSPQDNKGLGQVILVRQRKTNSLGMATVIQPLKDHLDPQKKKFLTTNGTSLHVHNVPYNFAHGCVQNGMYMCKRCTNPCSILRITLHSCES